MRVRMTKKTARRFAVALGVSMMAATGTVSASAAVTKHIKCTPGVQKGKPFKSVIKGHAGLYRRDVVYPKNSGHEIIGGMCQANKKGLGRKKLVTIKLFPKATKPKPTPPTTVVGDPPTVVVTPPAPPVVVTPPAPPAPTICTDVKATNFGGPLPCSYPPPLPQYNCTGLAVTQPNGSGVMRATVAYTASNGAVFDHATLYPGTGTPGGDQIAITSQNANFTYTYDGSQSSYFASATVTFRLPDGSLVTTEIDPDAGPGHCSAFVSVPLPSFVCGGPNGVPALAGLNPLGSIATVGAHYTALNRAQFRDAAFDWGDGSSNTTQASSFNEADFAHIYPAPGDYPLVVTFHYAVPYTLTLLSTTCSGIVHVPVPAV